MKKLEEILDNSENRYADLQISGLTLDSRLVKPGDLFIAVSGTQTNGCDYIDEALQRGAIAVLVDQFAELPPRVAASNDQKFQAPIILVSNLKHQLGALASRFYDHPSREMKVIGITGTNGKTTCSYLLAQALQQLGVKSAVMGTTGNGFLPQLEKSSLTTMNVIENQAYLSKLKQQGAKVVAMEVSSHALDQGRVDGIAFTGAVFTNLSRDHLDYHGDFENYWKAKKRLFDWQSLHWRVTNLDDPYGAELSHQTNVKTFSMSNTAANIVASKTKPNAHGLSTLINKTLELQIPLLGQFNLANSLAVLACLQQLGFTDSESLQSLSKCRGAAGRMQLFKQADKPAIVVDYAHTPDALSKALQALRQHFKQKIICIFGCGGNRDKGKRPLMAQAAEHYADEVILTDDNPRYEDPTVIVSDIQQGFKSMKPKVEHDRPKALQIALELAASEDVILLAGKGHEDHQERNGVRSQLSDIELVKNQMNISF